VNKSVSSRRVVRELRGGQVLLGIDYHDARTLFAMQKCIDVALAWRFGMLFTVFTRLNSSFYLSSKKSLIGRDARIAARAEKVLKMVDRFREFENTRRQRFRRKLYGTQNLSAD